MTTSRYFYDCEFYEDGTTIDLISIGVVCDDGREYYACSLDARLDRVSEWVRKNVLPHLPGYGSPAWMTRQAIAAGLGQFIRPAGGQKRAELWAYYADYDHVCLCQLFGTMMQLPAHFPMFTRDLKQLSVDVGSPKHPHDPKDEHNALADARWNRDLYTFLMSHKPMTTELVRKLREQAEEHYYAGYGGYDVTMRAAADELERLSAENTRMRQALETRLQGKGAGDG